jgi:hypothetical protein
MFLLFSILFTIASLLCIRACGLKLVENHDSDIRVICYFFSLSLVISMLVIWWATYIDAIKQNGDFNGEIGSYLNEILKFMLDLKTDVIFVSALFVIILVPQLISYLLSGLFGCAKKPRFVSTSFDLLIWGVVKPLITGAGIFFALIASSLIFSWEWKSGGAWSLAFTMVSLLACSFLVLWMYRDAQKPIQIDELKNENRVLKTLQRINRWLTRNLTNN